MEKPSGHNKHDMVVPILMPSNTESEAEGMPKKNPDFVLIWNSKSDAAVKDTSFERRSIFEYNLEEEGLILEWENSVSIPHLHAIKIWTPVEVLKRYAEILKLRLPMKEFGKLERKESQRSSLSSLRKSSEWLHECWGGMGKCCDLDDPRLTKRSRRLTGVYSREREYLFDIDDSNIDQAFPASVRARIVKYILTKTAYKNAEDLKTDAFAFGIERLMQKDVYEAAYPLHDGRIDSEGTVRKLLNDNWGSLAACCKFQPLDAIKNYFGVNIAIYFAWLGFYTRMLLFAAFFGIICFIYGLLTVSSDQFVKDVCHENYTMCPLCDNLCGYWDIAEKCTYAKVSYLFDNEFSFLFALFMSIWAAIFLELWKRYTAKITHHWDLSTFDLKKDFNPRPEYVAELKRIYSENAARNGNPTETNADRESQTQTQQKFDDFDMRIPFWSKQLPFGILSYSMVFLMVITALAAMIGVILYRLWFTTFLYFKYEKTHLTFGALKSLISVTAALINLTFILVFGKLYKRIAMILTNMEFPRTHVEFESSYTFKVYLLEFINNYGSIFYVAFIKGAYLGSPNKYHKIFGWRQEECGLGCMPELCIQLAVIMLGKQARNIFFEAVLPLIQRCCKKATRKVATQGSKSKHTISEDGKLKIVHEPQWIQDYELLDWDKFTLIDDYLDMVIQLGFITIFVAAFPLAPFFALINNIIELRLDANKMLTHYQRPVGYRAKGIGVWSDIVDAVLKIAVISNALIIALTSNFIPKFMYRFMLLSENDPRHGTLVGYLNHSLTSFAKGDLQDPPARSVQIKDGDPQICFFQSYRYDHTTPPEIKYTFRPEYWIIWVARIVFVLLYENFVYLVLMFIRWAIPDVPSQLRTKMEKEERLVNELILKHEQIRAHKLFRPRHRRSKGSSDRPPTPTPAPAPTTPPPRSPPATRHHHSPSRRRQKHLKVEEEEEEE